MARLPENQRVLKNQFPKYQQFLAFKKFLANVVIGEIDDCWEWKGDTTEDGYGRFWWPELKIVSAHVAAYELFVGKRHGLCVCHSCDNPICVNPNHLWLGTNKQNTADRVEKGRTRVAVGEANGASKLTCEQVLEIRKLYSLGTHTMKRLAVKFGVGVMSIFDVVHQKTWKEVSEEKPN